jgi:hypothetical protein
MAEATTVALFPLDGGHCRLCVGNRQTLVTQCQSARVATSGKSDIQRHSPKTRCHSVQAVRENKWAIQSQVPYIFAIVI